MLDGETGLERFVKPEGDVGVLRRIFGRFLDHNLIESFGLLSRPGDIGKFDRLVIEMALRQLVHAMPALSAIERIRHQHRVVIRRDINAVTRQYQRVIFQVLANL